MKLELTEFPQEGIDYSQQVIKALEESPWLEEAVHSTVTTLMTDLLDAMRGVPIPGQSVQGIEHLKKFAAGGTRIGVRNQELALLITRRAQHGWEITHLETKSPGLH